MKKEIYMLVVAFIFAGITCAQAQEYKYEFNSKYRVVHKEGKEAKDGLPGLGVGNIIFSSEDLIVGDDSKYKVQERFNVYDLGDFQARAFFPASMEKILEKILEKYPTYKMVRWIARGALVDPDGYRIAEQNIVHTYDSETRKWEGLRYMMHAPQNNWRGGNMIEPYTWKSKDFAEGIYYFVITTKLIFEKTDELIGYWDNGVYTEKPAVYEIVIARGQCELEFREELYVEPGEGHVPSKEQQIRDFYKQQEEENKSSGKTPNIIKKK